MSAKGVSSRQYTPGCVMAWRRMVPAMGGTVAVAAQKLARKARIVIGSDAGITSPSGCRERDDLPGSVCMVRTFAPIRGGFPPRKSSPRWKKNAGEAALPRDVEIAGHRGGDLARANRPPSVFRDCVKDIPPAFRYLSRRSRR